MRKGVKRAFLYPPKTEHLITVHLFSFSKFMIRLQNNWKICISNYYTSLPYSVRHDRLFSFPNFSVRPKKIPSRKSKMDMHLNVQNQILMGSLHLFSFQTPIIYDITNKFLNFSHSRIFQFFHRPIY